jgi:hypothetical protein
MEALDQSGTTPAVMRIRNGAVEKVDVQTGIIDAATERVELTAGVAIGDTLLLGAARSITPNTPVKVTPRDGVVERPQD